MDSKNLGAAPELAPVPAPGGVTDLNVTPLIDVLLVLFITFVVAFSMSQRTLSVELPAGARAGPVSVQMLLELPDAGGYRLNGQPVPGEQLADLLASVFRTKPVKLLFIKAGAGRSYQEFIEAADIARGVGVTTVAEVGY
jgi:biopolymer transport protein TolR